MATKPRAKQVVPVTVEGVKLPIQPVILKSDAPAKASVDKSGIVSHDLGKLTKVKAAGNCPPLEGKGIKINPPVKLVSAPASLPADYEYVNHPKHYGNHPSGVEAIELCEALSFNVGNGFKYVYRRDDKLTPIQDLNKTKWYIEREITRLRTFDNVPLRVRRDWVANPDWAELHDQLADKVVKAETSVHAKNFYQCVLQSDNIPYYADALKRSLAPLTAMIKQYEAKEKKASKIKNINLGKAKK